MLHSNTWNEIQFRNEKLDIEIKISMKIPFWKNETVQLLLQMIWMNLNVELERRAQTFGKHNEPRIYLNPIETFDCDKFPSIDATVSWFGSVVICNSLILLVAAFGLAWAE